MDRDQKSNVDERSSTFRLQYVLCFTETQWIACKLKFIDATVFFPSIFYFFFSAAKRHADMTKSAKSLRLPEGGIYPGEALCLISPFGVSEMRYPRRGGPFVIWAQWLICERALPYPSRGGPEDVTATDGRTNGQTWGRWWTPPCSQCVWFMQRFIATNPSLDVIQVTRFRTVVNENAYPFFPCRNASGVSFFRKYTGPLSTASYKSSLFIIFMQTTSIKAWL